MNSTPDPSKEIYSMIDSGESIEAFEKYYHLLSSKAHFAAMTIRNETFYRARKDNGQLIDNISKIKYPPKEKATKGRLNDEGEVIAYLSSSEIATIAELDIGYYDIYCTATIQYVQKDIIFHLVGIKKNRMEVISNRDLTVFNLYRELLTTKDKNVYNATTGLARHLLYKKMYNTVAGKIVEMKNARTGLLYSSVQEDKSNAALFNIAVKPKDFDECFRISEVTYNMLRYWPEQDAILTETINRSRLLDDGQIQWDLSYDEMKRQANEKFDGDIFKLSNSIVCYRYGVGPIESENAECFYVRFNRDPKTIREIKRDTIKNG